jgi:hypothetical protein
MILRIAYGNSVQALTLKYFLLLFFRSTVGARGSASAQFHRAEFFDKFFFQRASNG